MTSMPATIGVLASVLFGGDTLKVHKTVVAPVAVPMVDMVTAWDRTMGSFPDVAMFIDTLPIHEDLTITAGICRSISRWRPHRYRFSMPHPPPSVHLTESVAGYETDTTGNDAVIAFPHDNSRVAVLLPFLVVGTTPRTGECGLFAVSNRARHGINLTC